MKTAPWRWLLAGVGFMACGGVVKAQADNRMTEVRLITLDPGHFHAALLQREMLPGIARRVSHEAHFALLVRQFLAYQNNPDLMPAWELPFMLAKYHVTTEGVRLGRARPHAGPSTVAR